MARLLQILPIETPPSVSTTSNIFLIVAAILAVCSIVSFLCTSHKRLRSQPYDGDIKDVPSNYRKLKSDISGISRKALLMAKMISWRKIDDEDEEALWKKTIIMGERCRPLDFSGRILYDSEGKQLQDVPKRSSHLNEISALASTQKL